MRSPDAAGSVQKGIGALSNKRKNAQVAPVPCLPSDELRKILVTFTMFFGIPVYSNKFTSFETKKAKCVDISLQKQYN